MDYYNLNQLQESIRRHPSQGRPLVFTNGCFDLLHVGHIRYLQAARQLGQALIVGVNSDRSVQTIKPPQPGKPPRPVIPELQRAEVLAALRCVDGVIIFSEPTADRLLNLLKPEIYAKGGDYTEDTLPETPTVRAYGGKIHLIKVEIPTSTTGIIETIRNS